ncbi:NUDIX domain-containing protein [Streptomyces telluris]|uniref:NUDIX domain-containing protein n=1 Tax=Streptomyces telluris TaxID=2720021 RepID=A0A9X2RR65_9ACTN|nr:NUDIX domain-containing protein [Streptomyces telluris]MCQ8772995.1 NUDIX domain-containing protein [Streptomyces telluris]NJP77956.1 NUDIX domain-containing protein [Streptomyces telluris]
MTPSPEDDPAAWHAYLAEGNAKQARKRVAADLLLRDTDGRFLLVKPTYKPGWDLPGGMAEANEAPDRAVLRELEEELGLTVVVRGLLVVDWVAPHGPWDDQVAFIFDGGVIDDEAATALRPRDAELSEARFTPGHAAAAILRPRLARRFAAAVAALASGRPVYLCNGEDFSNSA